MHKRIRFARGIESVKSASTATIPVGMPVFTTDTHFLYIGDNENQDVALSSLQAINADGATKLITKGQASNTSVATTDKKLIYFNDGRPVESSSSIGSSTQLIYLDGGQFKASTSNLGSNYPLKLVSGQLQENTGTLANNISGNAATATSATSYKNDNNQDVDINSQFKSIDQRLTNLGFKEGTIYYDDSGTLTEAGKIYRQGNFVIGYFGNIDFTTGSNSKVFRIIPTAPATFLDFKPKDSLINWSTSTYGIMYLIDFYDPNISPSADNKTFYVPLTINLENTNSYHLSIATIAHKGTASVLKTLGTIKFGYDCDPITNS